MGIDKRMGDWATSPPIVTRPVGQDPDEIDLDDVPEDERQMYLDARDRKARRLAAERTRQAADASDEST